MDLPDELLCLDDRPLGKEFSPRRIAGLLQHHQADMPPFIKIRHKTFVLRSERDAWLARIKARGGLNFTPEELAARENAA